MRCVVPSAAGNQAPVERPGSGKPASRLDAGPRRGTIGP